MKYGVYRNNQLLAEVAPQGEVTEKLFGEETVTMSFTLGAYVKFQIGDSVSVYGKSYYISTEPTIEKVSTKEYRYELLFNSIKYRLAEVQYFFYDEQNLLTMPEFSIMGTARRMIELIVSNANRTQSGWSVGVVEETETKLVDFSGYNCLAALTRISDEFGVEFWIDADKSIHLTERKTSSGYTFAYGKGKGLKSISRTPYTEASLITRLYAKGSEQNIPKGYRNGQKALRMDVPYLEMNTDKYGIVEHTQTFEDIYPKRVGTVTAVNEQNYLQFTDSTLDFDLNAYNEYGTTVLIAGTSAKVIFITGDLAGYTFEIKEYGFNSATKTFTLLKNKDEKSFDIPSENFRPKVGDQYILVDIMMPQSYVTAAEAELKAKALDYLEKNSKQRFIYTMEPDPIYFKNLNVNLKLGQTVRFKDGDFNLDDDIRVISLTKGLQNPHKVSFEIAEQATITQIVRNYIENEKKETAIKKEQKINAEMARRSYLFAEEIKNNVFDNEGYFDTEKIKPLSIETQHISVGGRSQQFTLPNILLTLSDDNLRLKNTAGQMVHLTINENAPRTWTIVQNETPDFSTNFNYIYLRAEKNGTNATFVVTEQRLMLDVDPIFYHFMIGSVSSVIDGVRRIKTNYGFTQIAPGEISTGRISSTNGLNYIDLLDDRIDIKAKVTFSNDSPALQQVSDSIQVGGRNLILKSETPSLSTYGGSSIVNASNYTVAEWNTSKAMRVQVSGGTSFLKAVRALIVPENGSYCSVSFFVKNLSTNNLILHSNLGGRQETILPNEAKRVIWESILGNGRGNVQIQVRSDNADFALWRIKAEQGTKATDWTPAPEDVEVEILNSKTESINASKAYADAQDALRKVEANAYADGKVTAAEQRAILDATNKADAAKSYATAQDALLRTQLEAYADGMVDAEEQARIAQAQTNLNAAKAYADAQDNLAKIAANAYADGIVDAEEQRAIADATAKMEAAKAHAQSLVNDVQVGGRNLIIGSKGMKTNTAAYVTTDRYNDFVIARAILTSGSYADVCRFRTFIVPTEREYIISFYAKADRAMDIGVIFYNPNTTLTAVSSTGQTSTRSDGFVNVSVTNVWKRYWVKWTQGETTALKNIIIRNSVAGSTLEVAGVCLTSGNKATDWTPAPEDVEIEILNSKTESINASKAYADAQDALRKVEANAYADGKVTAAEQRAILDATNKADAAKSYATAQDALLRTQLEAYADGMVDAEEQARIAQAQTNLNAAKAYADAQDNLAKIAANAYADGIVDAEEQRAIADATAKMEAAKAHAQSLVNDIQVGGRNLVLKSETPSLSTYGGSSIVNASNYTVAEWNTSKAMRVQVSGGTSFLKAVRALIVPENGAYCSISFFVKNLSANNLILHSNLGGRQETIAPNEAKRVIWESILGNGRGNVQIQVRSDNADFALWRIKAEQGTKATDWTPAPEDVEAQITTAQNTANQALGLTQAQTANITALQQKTNFLSSTAVSGNAVATGTLIVGNGLGANAGITGLGGDNDIFLWGGETYENRGNAEVWFKRNGHFRLKTATGLEFNSETGYIGGRYSNGVLGFKISMENGYPEFAFYKEDGTKVYSLGQNGIYYVQNIPESYTLYRLLNLNSNAGTDDVSIFEGTIANNITMNTNNYQLNGNMDSYLYQAGQNQYSDGNRQYEGYKSNQNKHNNVADGWYARAGMAMEMAPPENGSERILLITVMRISSGKVAQEGQVQINTENYVFN